MKNRISKNASREKRGAERKRTSTEKNLDRLSRHSKSHHSAEHAEHSLI